ncbi:MAG: hypothetical protein C4B55_05955 [Candidatus Methanophagaceae archaeon]|nr:MAG: hypothetical protein C4B55_05955 [Methanophagales archaeon]
MEGGVKMGFLSLDGIFKQRRTRYEMSEDEKFYLMNCSDLLAEIMAVIDGVVVMHDFFWEKVGEGKYEKEMRKCGDAAKSTLSQAEYIKAPDRFKEMHEHLVKGLKYLEDSYKESVVYLADRQREHIARAIELALLGSAELRDGNRQWEKVKAKAKKEGSE